jgi:hypothetical protein
MAEDNIPEALLQTMEEDAGLGLPSLTDREMAGILLDRLDYDKQLVAIEDLLGRNAQASACVIERMHELDEEPGAASDGAMRAQSMNSGNISI